MASKSEIKKKWDLWKAHCETVQQATPVDRSETPTQKKDRIARLLKDYAAFATYYFPHYCQSPSGWFHIKANKKIRSDKNHVGVYQWSRDHAKTTHLGLITPLHLKALGELNVMLLVGKNNTDAENQLANLQAELEFNQRYINDFGEQKNIGSWEEGEFQTIDGCAFFARGRGQSPRGLRYREKRPDYIFLTDIDDDELCKNPDRVGKLTDWVIGALYAAMSIKGGRFVMEGNLIAKNSILNGVKERLKEMANDQRKRGKRPSTYFLPINALDDKGNPNWPERFTYDEIQDKIAFMGYRISQREYFNNPIVAGKVFSQDWIQYGKLPKLDKYDFLIVYCDPSFKKTSSSDFKAIRFWGKRGLKLDLIKTFCRQSSISAMVKWWYDLYESLPEDQRDRVYHFMEGNFLQDIILDEFETEGEVRGYMLPIMPDKRKKPDKFQRIEAISPLWERGIITYNEAEKDNIDMKVGIEQTLAFEKGSGAHDDAPDADEGAINFLQKKGRQRKSNHSTGKRTHQNAW